MKKAIVLLLSMIFILLPCLSFAGKEYDTEEQLNAEEEFEAEEQLDIDEQLETEEQPVSPPNNARIGLGFGIPYGMLGVNFEVLPSDYFSILLGVGGYQGVLGLAVGLRGYVSPRSSIFRPRLTFLCGTVGVLTKTTYNYYNYKKSTTRDPITGTALGVGFSWKYSPKWGMDFDILYPFFNKPVGTSQSDGTLKVSLGFGYYFKAKKGSFSKK